MNTEYLSSPWNLAQKWAPAMYRIGPVYFSPENPPTFVVSKPATSDNVASIQVHSSSGRHIATLYGDDALAALADIKRASGETEAVSPGEAS